MIIIRIMTIIIKKEKGKIMIKEYLLLGIVIIFASIVFNYFKNNRLLDINESGLVYLKLEYQYMQSHPKLIFKEINGLENPEIIENFNIKEDLTIYYKVRFYQSGIYRYTVVKSAISSNSYVSGYGYEYGNGVNNFNYRGNILNKRLIIRIYIL